MEICRIVIRIRKHVDFTQAFEILLRGGIAQRVE
jgi:hypothetical protein